MLFLRSTIFNIVFYGFTALCCFALLPAMALPRKTYMSVLSFYFRSLSWLERKIINLDYEVRGWENVPKDGPFIVAAKHQSTYETMKMPLLFRDFSVILKRELMWIPVWGWLAAKAGMIPVIRGSREKALSSIVEGGEKIKKAGRPIIIFPQGTRVHITHTPHDKPYKQGVAHLAKALDLPIIPMALNSGYFWPRKHWIQNPGTVIFEFGKPIEPKGTKKELLKKIEIELETRSDTLVQEAKDKALGNKQEKAGN